MIVFLEAIDVADQLERSTIRAVQNTTFEHRRHRSIVDWGRRRRRRRELEEEKNESVFR